ncbi:hypothetical protein [Pedobacter sp. SYSU D00535]|uniref:hypothetical protein n=1 Tax=Pedobacter sp. SYSU D00535 TaxID=2810308 RepID=UPI001A959A38|nr:hypothetical protein [Pedobacter sp. SYSU D00535]
MTLTQKQVKRVSFRLKLALALLTVLLVLFFSAMIYMARKIEPTVADRIKETITSSTDGLYTISFSGIQINPLSGNVKLRDIKFQPDPAVYAALLRKGSNPTHIYTVQVKSLVLKGAHPLKAYFDRKLIVNALIINEPEIKVYFQNRNDDVEESEDRRTAWQRLSKYLKAIHIHRIELHNANFQYIDETIQKAEIDGVKNLSVTVSDLLIDSTSHLDKNRFYFSKDISLRIQGHEYFSRDSSYKIYFDELKASSSKKEATVEGFKLIPRFPEMSLLPDRRTKRIRYVVGVEEIKLENIDFKTLIDRRRLRASSLSLGRLELNAFSNKTIPKPLYDRGRNFPHVALKRFRLNTSIDTLKLRNSSITYAEYNPVTAKTGRVFFNSINGKVLNVTNDSSRIAKNSWAKSDFRALLFGKGAFEMKIDFDLRSAEAAYNYRGRVGEINTRVFNSVLRPLALMQFNSGRVIKAEFDVKADYRRSEGSIKLFYENLGVGIFSINENKLLQRNTLKSLVANNLLLKEDNPTAGEPLRVGRIQYYRPDSIAFFSSMWNSIYTGLQESIGLTREREQHLMNQLKGITQDEEVREKKRDLRREKRLKRRQKRNR